MSKPTQITAKQIQLAIGKMQVLKFHSPVVENIKTFWRYEYDVLSVSKSGMVCEFEVKVSRADFLRPKEKAKQRHYSSTDIVEGKVYREHVGVVCIPNYFSYCCPTGLIKPEEIPPFTGLYYFDGIEITEVQPPKRIHKHQLKLEVMYKRIMRYYSERTYLGNCRMTFNNNESARLYNERVKASEGILKNNDELMLGEADHILLTENVMRNEP